MPFSFILPIFYVLKPLDVRLWDLEHIIVVFKNQQWYRIPVIVCICESVNNLKHKPTEGRKRRLATLSETTSNETCLPTNACIFYMYYPLYQNLEGQKHAAGVTGIWNLGVDRVREEVSNRDAL